LFSSFKINKPINGIQNVLELFSVGQIDITGQNFLFPLFVASIKNVIEIMPSQISPDLLHVLSHICHTLKIFSQHLLQMSAAANAMKIFLPLLQKRFIE